MRNEITGGAMAQCFIRLYTTHLQQNGPDELDLYIYEAIAVVFCFCYTKS